MTAIAIVGGWNSQPTTDVLRAALPDDRIIGIEDGDLGPAREAEAVFGGFSLERFRAVLELPALRWIHTFSAGVDRYVPEISGHPDILLTNNSGAYDVPIAEHVIAMIFAAAKRVPEHLLAQGRSEWQREVPHAEVRGATLVILGMGSIGGELARLASGVGMRVIAVRRDAGRPGGPGVERVVASERFAEVAREADYVAVTAALTPATRGMLSAEVIAKLKSTAWVINIARGPIIDEVALAAALKEHRIGGAALDVFETEPLPATSPLWSLDNAILTPHISNSSPRLRERSLALVIENVRRFKAGEPLLNLVDRAIGY